MQKSAEAIVPPGVHPPARVCSLAAHTPEGRAEHARSKNHEEFRLRHAAEIHTTGFELGRQG